MEFFFVSGNKKNHFGQLEKGYQRLFVILSFVWKLLEQKQHLLYFRHRTISQWFQR